MSVLAQKVVGRPFGDYFFPFAAGVAFSFNVYGWTERIRKYSQRTVDVLNMKTGVVEAVAFLDLLHQIDHPDLYYAVSVDQEGHLTAPMFKSPKIDRNSSCLTFHNLLTQTPFPGLMKKILHKLETAYGRPVDVEFAWDNGRLYLLQCRTLSLRTQSESVSLPQDIPRDQILFTNNRGVTNGIIENIEYMVYVDPRAYDQITHYDEKMEIGRIVGKINRLLSGKRYALFGPGRWGSNDINLGVRVGYTDINNTLILGEIAFEANGSTPEASFGTHFFNDLVEAGIVPIAIYPDQQGTSINEAFLLEASNQLPSLAPDMAHRASVVHLIHIPTSTKDHLLHIYQDGKAQKGMGFFASHF